MNKIIKISFILFALILFINTTFVYASGVNMNLSNGDTNEDNTVYGANNNNANENSNADTNTNTGNNTNSGNNIASISVRFKQCCFKFFNFRFANNCQYNFNCDWNSFTITWNCYSYSYA